MTDTCRRRPMSEQKSWKLKAVAYTVITLLVLALGVAVLVALRILGVGWAWSIAAILSGIALFMLVSHSKVAPKVFPMLELLFPVIAERMRRYENRIAEQRRRYEQRPVVDKMEHILVFYNLWTLLDSEDLYTTISPDSLCALTEDFHGELVNSLSNVDTKAERIKHCAQNIAEHLKDSAPHVSSDLLELLSRERYGLSTKALWMEKKRYLTSGLAAVLNESGQLPRGEEWFPYQEQDLKRLLDPLQDFDLDLMKRELDKLSALWRLATRYLLFLNEENLVFEEKEGERVTPWELKPLEMLKFIEEESRGLPVNPDNLDILDEATLDVLIWVGENTIRKAYPRLSDSLVHSLCLVSLAIFLTKFDRKDSPMLKTVCEEVAEEDEAVRLAWAYLEFREDLRDELHLGGKEFVSVDYLAKNWADRVSEKKVDLGRGFHKEIHAIHAGLQEGTWLTRLPPLVDKTYQEILEDVEPQFERLKKVVETRPQIRESLKRIFKDLPPETVERYRELRESNAYLITFDSQEGNLAGLIDCLASDEKQHEMERLGIELQGNPRPKYIFKNYTRNARIGIAPKDWTLQEFSDHLQEDLEKVMKVKRELVPEWDWDKFDLKDIELIVSRFGPSKRDYYSFKSELSRPRAVPNIREVLADTLDIPALVKVIGYEQDEKLGMASITDDIMEGPITELISDQIPLTNRQRRALERQEQALKDGIVADQGCSSVQELSQVLLKGDAQQILATRNELAQLIATDVPQIAKKPQLCVQIAQDYMDTLMAVASVNEAYVVACIKDQQPDDPLHVDEEYVIQAGVQKQVPQGFEVDEAIQFPFEIVVYAEDMEIEPDWIQPYVFRPSEVAPLREFVVKPTKPGHKQIRVEFLYQRHWLAEVEFEVKVKIAETEETVPIQ
jgi:hypothetical protein